MGASMAGFYMFLLASFVGGIGNTLLQTTVNPYVAICGPIEKTAQRMCAMGIMNKSAWYLGPLFLSIFLDVKAPDIAMAVIPFGIAAATIALFAILMFFISLPEITAKGESEATDSEPEDEIVRAANRKTSIWQFPHLILGAIALFIYVGVETLSIASIIDFANASGLNNPADYAAIVSIGLVIGYITGIFLLQWVSQYKALIWFTVIALASSFLLIFLPACYGIYFLGGLAFAHSVMWGAIWGIAIDRLGKFTKKGASVLVVAIVGGALIPLIFGFLLDALIPSGQEATSAHFQTAYWLFIPCYLYILFYALTGKKLGVR
jgi:fucose permease